MTTNNQYMYTRVWEIHELLYPKPDDLTSPERFAVREAELFMWDDKRKKKKKRFFFLFNDILLLCKKENHKRFWLRIHITLRSPYVSVEDIENSSFNNEFRLHCRSRSFIIYANTADQKKDWVQDLKRSIEGTHSEEKKKSDKKDEPELKDDVKKTKKDPTTKPEKSSKDPEINDPDPAPQKKEERNKSKKPSSKRAPKQEENLLPFDPFAPTVAAQPRVNNSNPFSPSPVANPFLGGNPPQPNLIATTPLSGGNFEFGFNPSLGSLQVNMGLMNLNQPSGNFNPNPLAVNPSVATNFNANPFTPGMNPVNPNVGYNQPANPPANPYASGGFSVAGANPFTSGSSFNNQSGTVASNPFTTPVQNTNPFLSNPSSTPFSNQNPLF
jgi:hypothetical protein